MRGLCKYPGLVRGEACLVRVKPLGPNVEFVGRMPPNELFERELLGTVHAVGGKRGGGDHDAEVRLLDPWLELNTHPFLSRLFGAEPPSPFPYEIRAKHFLNGWTRAPELKMGDACYVWIKAEGNIPWLERPPNKLPSEFPGYPHARLAGFWKARITAITRPMNGDPSVRKVRAVLLDERIRRNPNPRVSELYGHEPWTDYAATLTDDVVMEAGGELLDDLGRQAGGLMDRLGKFKLPDLTKGPTDAWHPGPEDFDSV